MTINSCDACFILAAGKGTRMGKIGESLPKPLWPLFNQTLFSATLEFWKSKGFSKFYANVHHGSEQMIPYLETLGVTPVFENELLGSGGAFHNLKKQFPSLKRVLSVNCDNFPLVFQEELFQEAFDSEEITLFSMPVIKGQEFNRLSLEEGYLKGIVKDFSSDGVTYTGTGIINLELLKLSKGVSSFFETVADFKKIKVKVVDGAFDDFLDFGTFENYYNSKFTILNEKAKDLRGNCSVEPERYLDQGNIVYNNNSKVNFDKCIILEGSLIKEDLKNSIVFNEIIQKV
jgi:NDP-sugar pyrophosphorylase family protein